MIKFICKLDKGQSSRKLRAWQKENLTWKLLKKNNNYMLALSKTLFSILLKQKHCSACELKIRGIKVYNNSAQPPECY